MPAPRLSQSSDAGSSDTVEDQTLILHRLNTGPQTASQQDAKGKEEAYGPRGADYSDEDGDEEAFLGAPADQQPALDKTGRPDWLEDGIQMARSSRRVRMLLGLGVLLLLLSIFSFVFAGVGNDARGEGRFGKIYKWAGDVWHAGGTDTVPDLGSPFLFPTDVGYPGPTQTGKPADLADEDTSVASPTRGGMPYQTNVPEAHDFELFKHMGPLTPYASAPDFSISSAKYRPLPDACRVERVHILHRHGSRYPTTFSSANDVRKIIRDARVQGKPSRFTGPLAFLNHYDPDRLGLELLVPVGRQQLFESGVLHNMEYGALADRDAKEHARIMVRAGSQQRIVDSAIAFLQGMFGSKWHSKTDLEIQIEAAGFNTTLAPNFACPNAGKPGVEPGPQWAADWANDYLASAVERLQKYTPSGVQWNGRLLNAMQQLCSFDTVAFGRSDFCRLFTEDEWRKYEYYWDLYFYGGYGSGSDVGKAQGLGWVNEFMSRLTHTPWNESTQTSENATLDRDPRTFPVDRRFYADFTHDSTITSVLAALHLPDFAVPLPIHQPDPQRKFKTSTIVPYAARMVFEEIECGESASSSSLIRLLFNEAIIDLHQLQGCPSRVDGMCPRSDFLAAMSKRNEWSAWDNCTKAL